MATVTVSNSPNAKVGAATVSGTGTALDGTQLAAGGGQRSITLSEPSTVSQVTVTGVLTWAKYDAPFRTTATQPAACAAADAASDPAASTTAATTSSANADPVTSPAAATATAQSGDPADANAANTANAANAPAAAAAPAADPRVTLCHATNSNSNPYVQITVAAAGAFNGHLGHTGPIWNPTLKASGISWGDIIPPFTFRGNTYSLNWPAGMSIFNNGCSVATPPTRTTTATVTAPGPTVTVTGPTVTVGGPTVTVHDTVTGPTVTVGGGVVTETVTGPTVTVLSTVTEQVFNCPPGAGIEGGSAQLGGTLAFTGSGGNDAMMSMLGGALTAGGFLCLLMSRQRRGARAR